MGKGEKANCQMGTPVIAKTEKQPKKKKSKQEKVKAEDDVHESINSTIVDNCSPPLAEISLKVVGSALEKEKKNKRDKKDAVSTEKDNDNKTSEVAVKEKQAKANQFKEVDLPKKKKKKDPETPNAKGDMPKEANATKVKSEKVEKHTKKAEEVKIEEKNEHTIAKSKSHESKEPPQSKVNSGSKSVKVNIKAEKRSSVGIVAHKKIEPQANKNDVKKEEQSKLKGEDQQLPPKPMYEQNADGTFIIKRNVPAVISLVLSYVSRNITEEALNEFVDEFIVDERDVPLEEILKVYNSSKSKAVKIQ